MEEDSVSFIRESTRNLVKLNRRNHRDEENDIRRSIPISRVDEKTVTDIANKLKTKSAVTVEELRMLKNALLDNVSNINIVLSTHGALRGLVRELSGHSVSNQMQAAGCCCNLALGEQRGALLLARAAGSYLLTCLDTLSTELAVASAWSLGNLSASSVKCSSLLVAQGALTKLLALISTDSPCLYHPPDLADALLYALQHLVCQMRGELSTEQLSKLLQVTSKLELSVKSSHILFVLSCHTSLTSIKEVNQPFLMNLLQLTSVSLSSLIESPKKTRCELLYLVRALANVCVETRFCDTAVLYFVTNSVGSNFKQIVVMNNDMLNKSVFWLLGNLFKFTSNSDVKEKFFKDVL